MKLLNSNETSITTLRHRSTSYGGADNIPSLRIPGQGNAGLNFRIGTTGAGTEATPYETGASGLYRLRNIARPNARDS